MAGQFRRPLRLPGASTSQTARRGSPEPGQETAATVAAETGKGALEAALLDLEGESHLAVPRAGENEENSAAMS